MLWSHVLAMLRSELFGRIHYKAGDDNQRYINPPRGLGGGPFLIYGTSLLPRDMIFEPFWSDIGSVLHSGLGLGMMIR